MVKHIVLWKLKDHAEGKTKAENAQQLKREFESLASTIPVIRKLEVGINVIPGPEAYDLALVSEFATRTDVEIYQKHPDHQRIVGILRQVRDTRVVVDYEF